MKSIEQLNELDSEAFAAAVAPLFEGAPRFTARLAEARPFESEEELFDAARATAREMPEEEQVELLDAHPRIGADPAAISDLSRREQGAESADGGDPAWIADELTALNEAYEGRFGFRFVVFVAGRPRADIIPILERALHADRDEELRRGLDDVIWVAADRMERLRGPRPLREELREAIALEVSRWMVAEIDRDGLIRATHRLIEEGVESPALLALSLANQNAEADLSAPVARLMAEIGLAGWDRSQAGQLLALHAAASILGQVSQPIDGARRIAQVSGNAEFRELVGRWEADAAARDAVDAAIVHAASELFGPAEQEESDE
ncbi:MAG TPA: 2-oxo-4-hydroxy-4-carboxy-5-ureidoimidazoline decarboxylase [Candidatus Limnocylindria bacterium]